jgi:hypothetical protein
MNRSIRESRVPENPSDSGSVMGGLQRVPLDLSWPANAHGR